LDCVGATPLIGTAYQQSPSAFRQSQLHGQIYIRDENMDDTIDDDSAGPSRECANQWSHLARLFQCSEFSEIFLNVKWSNNQQSPIREGQESGPTIKPETSGVSQLHQWRKPVTSVAEEILVELDIVMIHSQSRVGRG